MKEVCGDCGRSFSCLSHRFIFRTAVVRRTSLLNGCDSGGRLTMQYRSSWPWVVKPRCSLVITSCLWVATGYQDTSTQSG